MQRWLVLGMLVGLTHCGGPQTAPSSAPDEGAEAPDEAAAPSERDALAASSAEPAAEPAKPACWPSETKDVPPTTEPICPPETCLESEPGLLATCIDTKHKGCTHYLLARVRPDGTTEPLSVYVRCPSGAEPGETRGTKVEGTLMKSYKETGVPSLPDQAKPPEKACTHIAAYDCPKGED